MTTPIFSRYSWFACFCGMMVTTASHTAPGTIADTPLFTATSSAAGVPSNIVFQLDDSGSMGWDYLTKKYWDTCRYDPSVSNSCSTSLIATGNNIGDWRDNTPDMNILAYNPNVTYVDWKAGDHTNYHATSTNPEGNAALSVIPNNFSFEVWTDNKGYTGTMPDNTSSQVSSSSQKVCDKRGKNCKTTTTTVNLMSTNINNTPNGMVDYWDTHTTYTLSSSTATAFTVTQTDAAVSNITLANQILLSSANNTNFYGYGDVVTYTPTTPASPTAGGYNATVGGFNGRTLAQEKQNIANWYQYYRIRLNVAKGAIGQVVDANPKFRYGLNTIWNTSFVEVPSQFDPANTTTIRTDYVTPNKALLTTLYNEQTDGRTPLPSALDRVGRYFQHRGLPPLNSTTGTSFTPTAPIVYECQQNFAILFTDGYWNSDLDSASQTTIEDADGDGIGSSTDPTTSQRHSTVADVARYYYTHDLDTTMLDKVPANTDPAFVDNPAAIWQHMVTFTVAFGLQGNLVDTDGDGWPNPSLLENGNWGDPSGGTDGPAKIDDLWHAAFNGRGLYVSAASPEEVSAGFANILSNISKRDYAGSATSASFSVSSVSGGNSAYVSQFGLISNIWSGDLVAYNVNSTTGVIATTPRWRAATQLDALNATNKANAASSRHIFTYNPVAKKGVPFQWLALSAGTTASPTISLAQQDLGTGTSGTITTGSPTSPDATALARLNYLRGDQTNEGAGYNLRIRSYTDTATPPVSHNNLLGDIIHSDPLLVSTPQGAWPTRSPFPTASGSRYRDFKSTYSTRNAMVYVGANDGMLHAFKASDGSEAMAYIPHTLFSASSATTGLHYLTDPRYVGQNHRYYVDAPPVVEDVYIDTGSVGIGSGTRWHTVLVGGLMAGGRGIYALDVTDPSVFQTEDSTNAAKIALWEFNSTTDPDMGYSFSIPNIVMMNNNRWAAVFGNGYNNTGSGKAALFIVFLDGGVDGVWTAGTDYLKITATTPSTNPYGTDTIVGSDCLNASSNCNGLSTPQTVDLNNDSVIDRIYAGDLKGNMWAFDVSGAATTDWKVAYDVAGTAAPLFTASHHIAPTTGTDPKVPVQQLLCGTAATPKACRQAITSRPTVIRNKKSTGYNPPNLLVLFGTGQYLNLADTGNTDIQSFYGVWDHGVGSLTPATANSTTAGFIEQTFLLGPFYDQSTPPVDITNKIRVLSDKSVNYTKTSTTNHGWFINLSKAAGERQIVNTDVLDEKYLFFNTWIPGETTSVSTESCTVEGNTAGSGYLMSVNLFTGGAADKALFDLNGSGTMTDADKAQDAAHAAFVPAGRAYNTGLPGSSSFLKGLQYTPGTDAGTNLSGTTVVEALGEGLNRRAWQELRSR